MKIAVSYDEHSPLVDAVIEDLAKRGHDALSFGPRAGEWNLKQIERIGRIERGWQPGDPATSP